jgi:hypothetical protein
VKLPRPLECLDSLIRRDDLHADDKSDERDGQGRQSVELARDRLAREP